MVWLKSQADETLPITPIGRTPERREIADAHRLPSTPSISCSGESALPNKGRYLNLFIRPHEYQSGPHTGPRVLPINGSHERSNANWPPILCTNWRSPGEFTKTLWGFFFSSKSRAGSRIKNLPPFPDNLSTLTLSKTFFRESSRKNKNPQKKIIKNLAKMLDKSFSV